MTGMPCDKNVPLHVKKKFDKTVARPKTICVSEFWALNDEGREN